MIEITRKGKTFKFKLQNNKLIVEHKGKKTNATLFKNFDKKGRVVWFGKDFIKNGLDGILLEKKQEKYKKLKELKEKGQRRKLFKKLIKKENRKKIKNKAQENGGYYLISNPPIMADGELYIYATPEGEAVKNRIKG